jgi:uncharacterized protein (TIGR00369 family)
MKNIRNPYTNIDGYCCFGCSPDNNIGLKMNFIEIENEIWSYWEPNPLYQGYKNVLHGGIQVTLMDEIASWVLQVKLKTAGVTSGISTRFLQPVFVNNGKILLKASVVEVRRSIVDIMVDLFDNNEKLCAQSIITYFAFNETMAREKLFYPGVEAFYENE